MMSWQLNLFRDLSDICTAHAARVSGADRARLGAHRSPLLRTAIRGGASGDGRRRDASRRQAARARCVDGIRAPVRSRRPTRRSAPRCTRRWRATRRRPQSPFNGDGGDWRFEPTLPGLVHPIATAATDPARDDRRDRGAAGLLLIQLDLDAVRSRRASRAGEPLLQRHRRPGLSGRARVRCQPAPRALHLGPVVRDRRSARRRRPDERVRAAGGRHDSRVPARLSPALGYRSAVDVAESDLVSAPHRLPCPRRLAARRPSSPRWRTRGVRRGDPPPRPDDQLRAAAAADHQHDHVEHPQPPRAAAS